MSARGRPKSKINVKNKTDGPKKEPDTKESKGNVAISDPVINDCNKKPDLTTSTVTENDTSNSKLPAQSNNDTKVVTAPEDEVQSKGTVSGDNGSTDRPRRALRRPPPSVATTGAKTTNKTESVAKAESLQVVVETASSGKERICPANNPSEEPVVKSENNQSSIPFAWPIAVIPTDSQVVQVRRSEGEQLLDWPVDFISLTKTTPVLIYSVNPMEFQFTGMNKDNHETTTKNDLDQQSAYKFLPRQVMQAKKNCRSPANEDEALLDPDIDGVPLKVKKKHKKKSKKSKKGHTDVDGSSSSKKRKFNAGEAADIDEPIAKKHKKHKKSKKIKKSCKLEPETSNEVVVKDALLSNETHVETLKIPTSVKKINEVVKTEKVKCEPQISNEDIKPIEDKPTKTVPVIQTKDVKLIPEKLANKETPTTKSVPLVSSTTLVKKENTKKMVRSSRKSGLVAYSSDEEDEEKQSNDVLKTTPAKTNKSPKNSTNVKKETKNNMEEKPASKPAKITIKGTEKSTWDSSDSEFEVTTKTTTGDDKDKQAEKTTTNNDVASKKRVKKSPTGDSDNSTRSRRRSKRSYSSSSGRSRSHSGSSRSYSRSRSHSRRRHGRRRSSYTSYSRSRSRSYSSGRYSYSTSSRSSYGSSYSRSHSRSYYSSRSRSRSSRSRSRSSYRRTSYKKKSNYSSSNNRKDAHHSSSKNNSSGAHKSSISPAVNDQKKIDTLRRLQQKKTNGPNNHGDVPPSVKADILNKPWTSSSDQAVTFGPHLPGEDPNEDTDTKGDDGTASSVSGTDSVTTIHNASECAGLDIPLPKDKPKNKPMPGQWCPSMDFGGPVAKKKPKKMKSSATTQDIPLPTPTTALPNSTYIGPQVPPNMAKTLGLDVRNSQAEGRKRRSSISRTDTPSSSKKSSNPNTSKESKSTFVIPPEQAAQYKALQEQAKIHAQKQSGVISTDVTDTDGSSTDGHSQLLGVASTDMLPLTSGSPSLTQQLASMTGHPAGGQLVNLHLLQQHMAALSAAGLVTSDALATMSSQHGTTPTSTVSAAMLMASQATSSTGTTMTPSAANSLGQHMIPMSMFQQQALPSQLLAKLPQAGLGGGIPITAQQLQQLQLQQALSAQQQQQPMYATTPSGQLVQVMNPSTSSGFAAAQQMAALAAQHQLMPSAAAHAAQMAAAAGLPSHFHSALAAQQQQQLLLAHAQQHQQQAALAQLLQAQGSAGASGQPIIIGNRILFPNPVMRPL